MKAYLSLIIFLLVFITAANAFAAPLQTINRSEYASKLRGMWLGEAIANWTGIQTEGNRNKPPFMVQKDWGTLVDDKKSWDDLVPAHDPKRDPKLLDFVTQDPWKADDDTDIGYLYMHLMHIHQTPLLSPQQIAAGWDKSLRQEPKRGPRDNAYGDQQDETMFIWTSDLQALREMRKGVLPPATAFAAISSVPNPTWGHRTPVPNYRLICAQLTTELIGAVAPGMPEYALQISNLPIRTTSGTYATHAAQFYVLLYSLAAVVDPALSPREKVLWLANEARKYIPSTSKTADIFDTLHKRFLRDCPSESAAGCARWEPARDLIYTRYHRDAKKYGFRYFDWYESSVNFGTGILALLYGQGDLKRTIQIGTLSGWDSDNGTASMGGLLGLMNGYDWVAAQFPGIKLSDRYTIYRTRTDFHPDYLPNDPQAEDTFTMLGKRTLETVDLAVKAGGGFVRDLTYKLPPLPGSGELALSPTERLHQSSANLRVRASGGKVKAQSSSKKAGVERIADGAEHDFSGAETEKDPEQYVANGDEVTFTVNYDRDVPLRTLRFIEGKHQGDKGQYRNITPEILVRGQWQGIAAQPSAKLGNPPAQIIDWALPSSLEVRGIRVRGRSKAGSVTILELDALSE